MKLTVYQGANEWSALYKDGKLEKVGDHYLIDERIRELYEIDTIQSEDFMQGGNYTHDVAQTLEEVEAYTKVREQNERTVEELRAQARGLIAQADRLIGQAEAKAKGVA